ncbi:MAG: hypothetical protein K9M10_03090 [Candidatus Pacebacteria bacterium]|nr:hypothetical protein [Candidatus Paceibacterota bacterium]MCF7857439.1 hypothetical protein [Candidatus Paceibacterota bacterium]
MSEQFNLDFWVQKESVEEKSLEQMSLHELELLYKEKIGVPPIFVIENEENYRDSLIKAIQNPEEELKRRRLLAMEEDRLELVEQYKKSH